MLTEVRLLDKWGTHIKNLDYLERKKKEPWSEWEMAGRFK